MLHNFQMHLCCCCCCRSDLVLLRDPFTQCTSLDQAFEYLERVRRLQLACGLGGIAPADCHCHGFGANTCMHTISTPVAPRRLQMRLAGATLDVSTIMLQIREYQ